MERLDSLYMPMPMAAWELGSRPAQSRVPSLVKPLMAPLGILRAPSLSRESQRRVDGGSGLDPGCEKLTKMSGDPCRVGRDIRDFSRNVLEWLGEVLGLLFGGLG